MKTKDLIIGQLEKVISQLYQQILVFKGQIESLQGQNRELRELKQQYARVIAENEALRNIIKQQTQRIKELERRLGQNSQNSSKPPSSDGLAKANAKGKNKTTQSLRTKGQKKNGGQAGHKGMTLLQKPNPDIVEKHELTTCPTCEHSLAEVEVVGVVKRQVFDIPPPKLMVTEHQGGIKICPCCQKQVTACFPQGVEAPVQYGIGVQTWAAYLQHYQLIPEKRLQQMFMDLVQLPISQATIRSFSSSLYDQLEKLEKELLEKIKKSAVKHLDETGIRIGGVTQWLHVASTARYTYYHLSPKRKSLLGGMEGIVVHDHWKPYYQLEGVEHSLCNQHHLRELKSLIDNDQEEWAKKMDRFLKFSLRYGHAYGEKAIPAEKLRRIQGWYEQIIEEGMNYHEGLPPIDKATKRGRKARRRGHNMLLRLKNYNQDVLRFLTNRLVPFTNNQAERDLRMMKCKQKISGGFRIQEGAEIFARIRGYISTARKQGLNIFDAIQLAFQGRAPSFT